MSHFTASFPTICYDPDAVIKLCHALHAALKRHRKRRWCELNINKHLFIIKQVLTL